MNLKLVRDRFTDISTTGKLFIDSAFECFTLEDHFPDCDRWNQNEAAQFADYKIPGLTCIPNGTYAVVIDFSNRFQRDMPHILNVPLFDGVRIHKGNTSADTEGCVLLGASRTEDRINNSTVAFDAFFPKLKAALDGDQKVMIEIAS